MRSSIALLSTLSLALTLAACGDTATSETASRTETSVSCSELRANLAAAPAMTWADVRSVCQAEIDAYVAAEPVGHSWFANAANGFAGLPLVVLKSLPYLAPEIWGAPEENFSSFGLFTDPDVPDRVLPRGLGVAVSVPRDPETNAPLAQTMRPLDAEGEVSGEIDFGTPGLLVTNFACGACHSGRVRTADGMHVIEGAPNTQFDVRAWREAVVLTGAYLTPEKIGTSDAPGSTTLALLAAIDAAPPGAFLRGLPDVPAGQLNELDALQRGIVKQNIIRALQGMALASRASGWMVALQTRPGSSYGQPDSPGLAHSSAGMSDGSGDLLAQLTAGEAVRSGKLTEAQFLKAPAPVLPDFATVTDAPSVWRQADRSLAQWDGTVSMGFWRNIAAQLPIVGDPAAVDLYNTHIVDDFIHDLPSPPYPFDVNLALAARGEPLFAEHCAGCHKARNDTLYTDLGTDMNRARVLNEQGRALFLQAFTASCHDKSFSYPDPATGKIIEPCTMNGAQIIRDSALVENQGYVANVLDGIWARAPYLHNGSVPTLRHLFVPQERPDRFLRGALSYDTEMVGWTWQPAALDGLQDRIPTQFIYDSSRDGLASTGHDEDYTVDGKVARLDWSAPEHAEDLGALLEYLKTL